MRPEDATTRELISLAIQNIKRTDDFTDSLKGYTVRLSIEALREKAERENPSPLTLDELREMNGEPVWVESQYTEGFSNEWALIDTWKEGAESTKTIYRFTFYDKTWLAYRYKPKDEHHA